MQVRKEYIYIIYLNNKCQFTTQLLINQSPSAWSITIHLILKIIYHFNHKVLNHLSLITWYLNTITWYWITNHLIPYHQSPDTLLITSTTNHLIHYHQSPITWYFIINHLNHQSPDTLSLITSITWYHIINHLNHQTPDTLSSITSTTNHLIPYH